MPESASTGLTPQWGVIPSKYSNFFTVSVTPFAVRITFGEAFGSPGTATFHTAITMHPVDAAQLAQSIINGMEEDRKRRAAETQASSAATDLGLRGPKDGA